MSEFTMKAGDTLPALRKQLRVGGVQVDLTTAEEIRLVYKARGATSGTSRTAVVDGDATDGYVLYAWEASDTAVPGEYEYNFVVVWDDGDVQSFPSRGYGTFTIEAALA